MKRGFTLVELLAVIIILAIISTIVAPIVINIINDSEESTYKSSIKLYGKAVKQAVLNYELDKKVTPTSFDQIKPYLEFEGNSVECNTKIIYEDGEIYLKDCSVDGNLVEGYTYGKSTLSDTILKHATDNKYYYTTKPDFTKYTVDGEYGLYIAKDDLGDSYYFRGDVENNYVQLGTWKEANEIYAFAVGPDIKYDTLSACKEAWNESTNVNCITFGNNIGDAMYWRILRINGDGTIRLVYDGIEKFQNETPHWDSIGKSLFNEIDDDKYLGYTYVENDSVKDSEIKATVDEWYKNNFEEDYGKYVADGIFCNDKEITATDDRYKYYGAYTRIETNKNPQLTCTRNEDKYTLSKSLGNGLLSKPVGLMTADEVMMAGASSGYLYSDSIGMHTMTPSYSLLNPEYESYILIYSFHCEEGFVSATIYNTYGVRPVINLKADVRFTGTGTIDDPYVIMTD